MGVETGGWLLQQKNSLREASGHLQFERTGGFLRGQRPSTRLSLSKGSVGDCGGVHD